MIRKIRTAVAIGSLLMMGMITASAQNKSLTLEDLIPGGKTSKRFVPKSIPQLQWCGDLYLYAKGDSILGGKPAGKESVILTRKELNEALKSAGRDTISELPQFSTPEKADILSFDTRNHRIFYDIHKNQVVADYPLQSKGTNYDFCPANKAYAFTLENNLKILKSDGSILTVTNEPDTGIVCGQSVHQNEFGIHKGTFWNHDGSKLAFYRMDESMVPVYPLVNIDAREAQMVPHRYPMAGMKSHHVTVGIYELATGKTTWLHTGLPLEKYLTNITWSPDDSSIYIAELNRGQDEMHLKRYSVTDGKQELDLFTEKDEAYVEPQHGPLFLPNDNQRFIWQSERDGYNHLYLYSTDGKLIRRLTEGEWVVTSVLGFNKKGDKVIIEGTAPHPVSSVMHGSPMQFYAWAVDLDENATSSLMNCLSWKLGVHHLTLSNDGEYAIDNFSAPNVPHVTDLISTGNAKVIRTLLEAKNPFEGYQMPTVKVGHLKAADGKTQLNYRITLPPDLDQNKKYPVIIYVYGGPHAQLVTGDWMNGCRGWDIYMANRGYIIYTLDSRGSANRGHAFESVIHRHLGVNEMDDQMMGVQYLKSLPYVDSTRIGVHGWSYGGFMTTNLMLTYPDVFKTAVAGGPVIDWSKYEIMYGERYMDTPQENPDGYRDANLKLKAGNLKGHLLLIHGTMDHVVVWQHSLGFLKACVDAGTYPDYFVYPGHDHNVIGHDRIHLYEKITRYFDDYLK